MCGKRGSPRPRLAAGRHACAAWRPAASADLGGCRTPSNCACATTARSYRDGAPAGRVTLELIAQDDASLALISAPFADGLAAVLFTLLAEWDARPYLPVANRWAAFALDGAIDQKGRRIDIRDGKPVFID